MEFYFLIFREIFIPPALRIISTNLHPFLILPRNLDREEHLFTNVQQAQRR